MGLKNAHCNSQGISQGIRRRLMDLLARFKDGKPSLAHWVIELHIEINITAAKNGLEYTSQDMAGIIEKFSNSLVKTFGMLTEGIVHEKQKRFTEVRVRYMRQPTSWTVPNPDLGDHHFRDKDLPSTCLSRLISITSPRGTCLQ